MLSYWRTPDETLFFCGQILSSFRPLLESFSSVRALTKIKGDLKNSTEI